MTTELFFARSIIFNYLCEKILYFFKIYLRYFGEIAINFLQKIENSDKRTQEITAIEKLDTTILNFN